MHTVVAGAITGPRARNPYNQDTRWLVLNVVVVIDVMIVVDVIDVMIVLVVRDMLIVMNDPYRRGCSDCSDCINCDGTPVVAGVLIVVVVVIVSRWVSCRD